MRNRAPQKVLLVIAVLIGLGVFAYFYFFSAAKTISAAPVRVETGASSAAGAVLSASGYVVAHHKIAVGAKVMGRVAWIGVEKRRSRAGRAGAGASGRPEFRAQVNQPKRTSRRRRPAWINCAQVRGRRRN